MYISYEQYVYTGYNLIPEEAFIRFGLKAEQVVRQHTFNRITDENITDINRAGVCEIADALYTTSRATQAGEDGNIVTSFSNQNYSESYATPKDIETMCSKTITGVLLAYFTSEQLYRGVG